MKQQYANGKCDSINMQRTWKQCILNTGGFGKNSFIVFKAVKKKPP